MDFLKLTHTSGTEVYVNRRLVRVVMPEARQGARLVFEPPHEIFVKEAVSDVLVALQRVP